MVRATPILNSSYGWVSTITIVLESLNACRSAQTRVTFYFLSLWHGHLHELTVRIVFISHRSAVPRLKTRYVDSYYQFSIQNLKRSAQEGRESLRFYSTTQLYSQIYSAIDTMETASDVYQDPHAILTCFFVIGKKGPSIYSTHLIGNSR